MSELRTCQDRRLSDRDMYMIREGFRMGVEAAEIVAWEGDKFDSEKMLEQSLGDVISDSGHTVLQYIAGRAPSDALRARVEALEAENERLRRAVEIIEENNWGGGTCRVCEFANPGDYRDHAYDCWLARALRVADGEDQHG